MLQQQYMLSIIKVFRFQRKTFLLLYWLRLFLLLRVPTEDLSIIVLVKIILIIEGFQQNTFLLLYWL